MSLHHSCGSCVECLQDTSAVKQLTSERDAALAEVARLKEITSKVTVGGVMAEAFHQVTAERDQARSALSEARAALRRYGQHKRVNSELYDPRTKVTRVINGKCAGEIGGTCTCGLDTALGASRPGDLTRKGEGR